MHLLHSSPNPQRQTRNDHRQAGFSIVEVMVGLFVLFVAVCGALSSTVSSSLLTRVNRESMIALDATQAAMESLQATPFNQLYATFNQDPTDDPDGVGTAPGAGFPVVGLDTRTNDPDGMTGIIIFPGDPILREDVDSTAFRMPRDLNADGVIDAADHSGDYVILPVIVRVEWGGASGNRETELQTILCAR